MQKRNQEIGKKEIKIERKKREISQWQKRKREHKTARHKRSAKGHSGI